MAGYVPGEDVEVVPRLPYRCPHVCDYWAYPYWHLHCARCRLRQGLLDVLASLVLIGIFVFAWVLVR